MIVSATIFGIFLLFGIAIFSQFGWIVCTIGVGLLFVIAILEYLGVSFEKNLFQTNANKSRKPAARQAEQGLVAVALVCWNGPLVILVSMGFSGLQYVAHVYSVLCFLTAAICFTATKVSFVRKSLMLTEDPNWKLYALGSWMCFLGTGAAYSAFADQKFKSHVVEQFESSNHDAR